MQLVSEPTHVAGHWLDLVITNESNNRIGDVHVMHTMPKPHFAVRFSALLARPPAPRIQIKLRKIREIDTEKFRDDIFTNITAPCDDLNSYVSNYNSTLSKLLEEHAPLITRNITHRPNSPWYNDDLHNLKREKRAAERKWKKSGLTVHKQIFNDKCKTYCEALNASKKSTIKVKFKTVIKINSSM